MEIAGREPQARGTPTPVVVCIADTPEERTRLAGLFDGVGVLVMVSDADSARTFLGNLHEPGPGDSPDGDEVVRVGGLRLDLAHHEATWHGRSLGLTPHELKVLGCLASAPGRIWTYRQLHDQAWDGSYFTGPAAVQSVIKRLRAKLRESDLPLRIDAARGLGFRLCLRNDLHLVGRSRAGAGPRRWRESANGSVRQA